MACFYIQNLYYTVTSYGQLKVRLTALQPYKQMHMVPIFGYCHTIIGGCPLLW